MESPLSAPHVFEGDGVGKLSEFRIVESSCWNEIGGDAVSRGICFLSSRETLLLATCGSGSEAPRACCVRSVSLRHGLSEVEYRKTGGDAQRSMSLNASTIFSAPSVAKVGPSM